MGMLLGAVLFAVSYAHASHHATLHLYFVLLVLFPAVFITELFSRRSEPFHHIANTILGVIYIALPFSLMNYLVFVPCREGYDPAPVLAFFSCCGVLTRERILPELPWAGICSAKCFTEKNLGRNRRRSSAGNPGSCSYRAVFSPFSRLDLAYIGNYYRSGRNLRRSHRINPETQPGIKRFGNHSAGPWRPAGSF